MRPLPRIKSMRNWGTQSRPSLPISTGLRLPIIRLPGTSRIASKNCWLPSPNFVRLSTVTIIRLDVGRWSESFCPANAGSLWSRLQLQCLLVKIASKNKEKNMRIILGNGQRNAAIRLFSSVDASRSLWSIWLPLRASSRKWGSQSLDNICVFFTIWTTTSPRIR